MLTDEVRATMVILGYVLKDGPLPYDKVKAYCRERGVTRGDLRRARIELGIKTINTGKTWLWLIPEEEDHA